MSDESRFRDLFDTTYPTVIRYAYNRGYRRADAEDLTAATFEVAWRRLEAVPRGEDATPWLLAVARNLARNTERRARNQDRIMAPSVEPEDVPAPGLTAGRVEERDELLRALPTLKEADRELILLVARDGLSPAAAGNVLGLSSGAARSRLHRARNQLAVQLGVAQVATRVGPAGLTDTTVEG